ncbi:hypothetical protein BCR33DRAFT_422816 [Rhizoclosmatium globosum]|uniref:Uncharacterized protein n=1 Tax=Rhizoclosmatium globosum TaxID=329046 RepID=A0A1Y2BW41_9FUNG|nr:hypothetical protein BCR33DRAFT_422816 [Rhizoclosmatium globosum]|eukprot:ORY38877.1 hypothetical protein BCR33DRAFT_422816 [Rhizoclosmatium globosum]
MGPGYEGFFQAALFQEPASWTRNQSPCHAPHRAAPKQLNKQPSFKAATPISKPSTPAPKAQANNNLKGNKAAPVSATKNKNAIKWNSPAGKQLILRPKNELVIYTPLWIQVYHWAQFRGQKQQRGRSADKTNKAQRLQQQKQRIAAQRKPNDRQQSPAPKQLSRQASAVQPKSPATVSRQASSIQSKSPAPLSRQQSALQQKNKPASPIKKKGNSSPVDYSSNTWEQYYTPKLVAKSSYPVYEQAPAPKAAPNKNIKLAPGKSLKSKIPPPQEAKSPEIFSFVKSPSASAAHSRATSAQSNRNAAPLKKQPSASSPVSGPDFFAQYLDRSASPAPSKPTSRQASAKPLTQASNTLPSAPQSQSQPHT